MSTYENTCPDCGDTYITEAWEPTKCPFCEVAEYQRTEPLKLAERNGLLRELAEYQSRDGTCDWAENQDGAYETSCGEIFEFTNGGPKDNKFTHCPYCGKELDTPKPRISTMNESSNECVLEPIVLRSFRVVVNNWPEATSIVKTTSATKARYAAWRSAKEAGYALPFSDLRVRRAPEYDNANLVVGRPHGEDYAKAQNAVNDASAVSR
jgi:predicted RNA-binding Zn-ribbon protein involved in translation (DUF1610 family)